MKIAGLDIGTTGCKCTVFDEKGKYLGKAYRDYPVSRKASGHDIDVSMIMSGVYGAIGEMAAQYPDIGGIGVTSFGETFVFTDEAGTPLHTSMVYTDPRGGEECRELSEKLGERNIAHITGLRPHEMYSIPKMMYIKKHHPEVYAKAKHAFLMQDYVVFHLTGKAQIDYSLATRTMAFDISSYNWSKEVFDAAVNARRMNSGDLFAGFFVKTFVPDRYSYHSELSFYLKFLMIFCDASTIFAAAGLVIRSISPMNSTAVPSKPILKR